MRTLALITLLAVLTACDGKLDDPVVSNGNQLQPVDCTRTPGDRICVIGAEIDERERERGAEASPELKGQ